MNGKFLKVSLCGLLLACAASCQQTPQDKAEAMVQQYMQENLNDPASYESVEMGKLQRVSTEEYAWRACQREVQALGLPADSVFGAIAKFQKLHAGENIKGDTLWWELKHTYRANNACGAMVKQTYVFRFDKQLERIEATEVQ